MRPGSVLAAYLHPATEIQHSFHVSVMGVANHDAANHQRLFASAGPLMMRAGTGGLVDARNQVMAHFLDQAQEEEWLWMVDTDMGFPANVVDLLVDAADPTERPVVGALCFGLKLLDPDGLGGYLNEPFPTIYGWQAEGPDGYPGFARADDYPRDVLLRVAGTGAACLLIHRTVGEQLRAQHGDNWFSPVRYPDGRFVSEDLSFCYRLGQADIPLYVHTGIRTTHAKQLWVGEREWLAHRALTRLGEAVAEPVAGELVEPLVESLPDQPEQACNAEYTRPGGRQRGDRLVHCALAHGHDGEHQEAGTGVTWPAGVPELFGNIHERVGA